MPARLKVRRGKRPEQELFRIVKTKHRVVILDIVVAKKHVDLVHLEGVQDVDSAPLQKVSNRVRLLPQGYQLLNLTQQQLLLVPDDTWGQIVAKYLKKYKPKTDKDKVIQTLDPLRITNPDLIFVVVGWVALIDCDTTGVAVEMLHTKVTSRFQFSHELVDEVELLLLSLQRTLQVSLAGKKPAEKMTGVTELVSVLQARMEWLEKRLADRKRVNENPSSPPRKAIALKGDHH